MIDLEMLEDMRSSGLSYSEIAEELTEATGVNITRNVIAGILRDMRSGTLERPKTYVYGKEEPLHGAFPTYTGHPHIEGDYVVIADTHIPKTDWDMLEKVPTVAKYYGIRKLIFAGDLLDGDSRHHKRRGVAIHLGEQIKWAKRAINFLLSYFEEIHFIPGNHDEWFVIDNDHEFSMTDIGELILPYETDEFFTYYYDRIHVFSGGREIVVPHQANATTNPLTVPDRLAQIFQAAVICPHQHRTAQGLDANGRYQIASIGGLHNQQMFDYKQLKTTTFPHMHQGFAVIQDGYIEVIGNEVYTNWNKKFPHG